MFEIPKFTLFLDSPKEFLQIFWTLQPKQIASKEKTTRSQPLAHWNTPSSGNRAWAASGVASTAPATASLAASWETFQAQQLERSCKKHPVQIGFFSNSSKIFFKSILDDVTLFCKKSSSKRCRTNRPCIQKQKPRPLPLKGPQRRSAGSRVLPRLLKSLGAQKNLSFTASSTEA